MALSIKLMEAFKTNRQHRFCLSQINVSHMPELVRASSTCSLSTSESFLQLSPNEIDCRTSKVQHLATKIIMAKPKRNPSCDVRSRSKPLETDFVPMF